MKALRGIWLVFVVVAVVAVATACGDGESRLRSDVQSDLTLEEVYALMEEAIAGDGDAILHASVVITDIEYDTMTPIPTPEGLADFDAEAYADQLWIDAANHAARVEHRTRYQDESEDRVFRHIVLGDRLLRVDHEGRSDEVDAITCRGSESPLIAQLMRCGNWLEESTTTVESGDHDGDPAMVLVTTGELPSHDWTAEFETRLFIDPETNLPVASEHYSDPFGYRLFLRYDIEFMERSALPGDFFEPESIEFVEQKPVPADNLQREIKGMRVHWLGEEFAAGFASPLRLQQPNVYPGEQSPGPIISLSYKLDGNATPYRGLGISQYLPEDDALLEPSILEYWTGDEVTVSESEINGTRVRIYHRAGRYGDMFRAHLYFDTTLVVVNDYIGAPPYAGEEAFMRVLENLRPYEP